MCYTSHHTSMELSKNKYCKERIEAKLVVYMCLLFYDINFIFEKLKKPCFLQVDLIL